MTVPDATSLALTRALEHLGGSSTPHDRRIIDADLPPGGDPGWSDPYGKEADRAAAAAWWAMVEPNAGRWAS